MSALLGYSDNKKLVRISLGIPNHYRKLMLVAKDFINLLDTKSKDIKILESTQILNLKYLD